ncbi:NADP-dependent malic enzyme [archaeon]|jgi:malate dehydrogenase (oxaloacetate-decarboxylating)|nr:NADP-dependent malic enzyme [archaeon]
MNLKEDALKLHKENKGKIEVISKVKVEDKNDLSLAYSPGVAFPCLEISENEEKLYDYTMKNNSVLVISDGSAVLGLGNIRIAGLPVMEGKAILFKKFAGIDAIPMIVKTQKVDEIVELVKNISGNFGGVNLEDISAPRCFEIEERLKEELDIPVFHDDQHGTAIVVLAGLINALKIVGKVKEKIKVVVNGAGAAGIAISKLLRDYGVENIVVLDSKEAIYSGREGLNKYKEEVSKFNLNGEKGSLGEVLVGADVFIGVSKAGILSGEMVELMNKDSIIFALANPEPEIMPDVAKEAGARIVATGRSDFPNQVNNVLAFPGIFRGALNSRVKSITEEMKLNAAFAIASIVGDGLNEENIIPDPFDERVVDVVRGAVGREKN